MKCSFHIGGPLCFEDFLVRTRYQGEFSDNLTEFGILLMHRYPRILDRARVWRSSNSTAAASAAAAALNHLFLLWGRLCTQGARWTAGTVMRMCYVAAAGSGSMTRPCSLSSGTRIVCKIHPGAHWHTCRCTHARPSAQTRCKGNKCDCREYLSRRLSVWHL